MTKNYPDYYRQLQQSMRHLNRDVSGPMAGFQHLHQAAMDDGALSSKSKELIALAIAICVHCDGCIAYHVADALRVGATRDEITEAIGVAVMMGGGPAVIYGAEALEALHQFGANPKLWAGHGESYDDRDTPGR